MGSLRRARPQRSPPAGAIEGLRGLGVQLAQKREWDRVALELAPRLKQLACLSLRVYRVFVVGLGKYFLGVFARQKFDQLDRPFTIGSVCRDADPADVDVGAAIALIGEKDAHVSGKSLVCWIIRIEQQAEIVGIHDGQVTFPSGNGPDLVAIVSLGRTGHVGHNCLGPTLLRPPHRDGG